MCRPLWAAWVGEHGIMSELGEGSHRSLESSLHDECLLHGGAVMLHHKNMPRFELTPIMRKQTVLHDIMKNTAHPFEAVWTQKREAQWQPNTNRFYSHDDMPTRKHFDLAQARFEKDMGTPDLLRAWVLAGAKLYGRTEIDDTFTPGKVLTPFGSWVRFVMSPTLGETERLFLAASKTLISPEDKILWGELQKTQRKEGAGERAFNRWADMFSDRKNRVELWKN